EQRVRPRRSATLFIGAVRGGGKVAAVDGGAAGGVRDEHAVAEELRHEFDVRRFAAAGTSAGEFKQRLQKLNVFHLAEAECAALRFGNLQEEVPIRSFGLAERRLSHHVDGAV